MKTVWRLYKLRILLAILVALIAGHALTFAVLAHTSPDEPLSVVLTETTQCGFIASVALFFFGLQLVIPNSAKKNRGRPRGDDDDGPPRDDNPQTDPVRQMNPYEPGSVASLLRDD